MITTVDTLEEIYSLFVKLDMLQTPVIKVGWSIINRIQTEFRLPVKRIPAEEEESYMATFLANYKAGTYDRYLAGRELRWAFYRSPAWAEKKAEAYSVFGYTCMCCGASGVPLSVDHIISRKKAPERELDIKNLQILCIDCNKTKSGATMDYRKKQDLMNLIKHLGIKLG